MRRALLTASAALVAVGDSSGSIGGSVFNHFAWSIRSPAPTTGVLNTAKVYMASASAIDFAFFTVSPAGVVTGITDTITTDLVVGLNTFTLPGPLAVNAGDYIGIWNGGGFSVGLEVGWTTDFASDAEPYVSTGLAAVPKPTPGTTLTTTGMIGVNRRWMISAST